MHRKACLWVVAFAFVGGLFAAGCTPVESVPLSELPDPASFALSVAEMPDLGSAWTVETTKTLGDEFGKGFTSVYATDKEVDIGDGRTGLVKVRINIWYTTTKPPDPNVTAPPQPESKAPTDRPWAQVMGAKRFGDLSALWTRSTDDFVFLWVDYTKGHGSISMMLEGFHTRAKATEVAEKLSSAVEAKLPK